MAPHTIAHARSLSACSSSSIRNWIANIDTVKTTYPGCAGCEVHKGFYKSAFLRTAR